jgi:SAM-dependent methyltransferase
MANTGTRELMRASRLVARRVRRKTEAVLNRRTNRREANYDDRLRFWGNWLRDGYWDGERKLTSPHQEEKAKKIARALVEFCPDTDTLHEPGCGVGRNLRYILDARPDLTVSANDLDWEMCSRHMHPMVKDVVEFHEVDTLQFLRDSVAQGSQVDCVLVSDHLIHIPPDVIDEVLDLITRYARRHILFHEGVRRSLRREATPYWYGHDYAPLETRFSIVHREGWDSGPLAAEYELRVYSAS